MKLKFFRANNSSSLDSLHNMEYQYWARVLTHLATYLDDSYTAIFTDSRDHLPQDVDKKTVVVLIGNEDYVIPDYRKNVGAVFTHYMKSDSFENVYVVPHGTMSGILELPYTDILSREIPVLWYGWIHTNRMEVLNGLANGLNAKGIKWDIQKHNSATCPPSVYSQRIWNAQFSPCLRGGRGPESFRYYESMKYGLVTLIPNDVPDNWLYRETPAIKVEFNKPDEVVNVIADLLNKPEEMRRISLETKSFYDEKFSEVNVAARMYKIIKTL